MICAVVCTLHVKQVNSESNDSDDNPLALALRSLHFLPVLQALFVYTDLFLSDLFLW